ncbi:phosphotransferase enzyme family protein [Bacillus sp. SCS-153A]|uniref:phosphotransferase enzyme family protein n=1 Tax=Rossellomorea sedimentorum TaxID=3115294 RepID=UPI0039067255
MEKWVEELFNEDILKRAADFFDSDSSNAKRLGDFENYVFEVHKGGEPYILRLTHSSHRSKEQVEAGLEWVNFLHSQGVNVSLVSHSNDGKLVEEIPAGESFFYACLFDKAPGVPVRVKSDLMAPPLYKEWGRTIGKMHRVTKNYQQAGTAREHWHEDDLLKNMSSYLPEEDSDIVRKGKELIDTLLSLPADQEEYGLIHSDIHSGNFFYQDGEIHVFDFDDSSYHWFVSDIAIPLYYFTWAKAGGEGLQERSVHGEGFLIHFLKGYYSENNLADVWIKRIPLFLKLRDITLYSVFHKKFDMSSLSEWEAGAVKGIRTRLLKNEPMVSLDYENILARVKNE